MFLTPDMKLVHSILQKNNIGDYFKARAIGVRADNLFDEAKKIWLLIEQQSHTGRLPSLSEIELATGVSIPSLSDDPLDPELCAKFVVKRALSGELHTRLGDIIQNDAINDDPFKVRDSLGKLPSDLAWSYGDPYSINSQQGADAILQSYSKAANRGSALLGLGSPWPVINESSLGLQAGELTVLFAKRKCGKSITESTLIHDPVTGRERTLREIIEAGSSKVLTWEKNKPISSTTPSDYLCSGKKQCLRIKWRSGRFVEAALTHPFLTPRGWVDAGELCVGQHTGAVAILPEPLSPVPMSVDELVVLAYLLADGRCAARTPVLTNANPEIRAEFSKSVQALECEVHVVSNGEDISAVGRPNHVTELLKRHGLYGKKSVDKTISDAIFSLPNDQLGLFIGRLWSCDGCVERRNGRVSYSTWSRKLADQLQHLLLRFGVVSHIRVMPRETKDGSRDYFEVVVHQERLAQFQQYIALHMVGPKASKALAASFQGRSRIGWLHNDELQDEIYAEMNARPELLPKVGEALGYKFVFQRGHIFDNKSRRIRRRVFAAFCKVYDSPLSWILDENIQWDEIEAIEPAGLQMCYDLSVPGTECFVANDCIVHNSWITIVWAMHIWQSLSRGQRLLFVTMEMTPAQVLRRMACVALKFAWNDFRAGRLTTVEYERLVDWIKSRKCADKSDADIVVVGSDVVRTVDDLSAIVGEYHPDGVVVDSFYIMGRTSGATIYERVLGNVQELKLDIALKYLVPVLASTQLKGTVEADVLMADSDDAMGAKAIGDYADATFGLFVDTELRNAKKRLLRGMEAREFLPRGIKMWFDLEKMNFDQIEEINYEAKKKDTDSGKDKKGRGKKKKPPKPTDKSDEDTTDTPEIYA